jgi:uncharacterized membrane protein
MPLREELYHPISVHFPIAFLTLASVIAVGVLFVPKKYVHYFELLFRFQLYVGLFCFGIVLFTGDIAADIVKYQIQKPLAIQHHEDNAYFTLYLFILVLVVDALKGILRLRWVSLIKWARLVLSVIALIFLIETGHEGAELVYDQGAGVKIDSSSEGSD